MARGLAAPRLGRGVPERGRLDEAAKKAAYEHAAGFVDMARKAGAEVVVLAATQACRRAEDGGDFVARLGDELGLDSAVVLSGEQEAALSRLGALNHLQGSIERAWLADVGGGSTELTALDDSVEVRPMSLALGAVSLTEAHLSNDPPGAAELSAMARAALAVLEPVRELPIKRLVATAGTASTLASLAQGLTAYEPERINSLVISRGELRKQLKRLAALPLAQRKQALRLDPDRADIILAGLVILDSLLEISGLDELTAMDAGLLEGILFNAAAGHAKIKQR